MHDDPMSYLEQNINHHITVHTVIGDTYEGVLCGFDIYANVLLSNCMINSEVKASLCFINGVQITHFDLVSN